MFVDMEASIGDDWELIFEMDVYPSATNYNYKVPLYIVDKFPEAIEKKLGKCVNDGRVAGCWTGNSIYILEGKTGIRGEDTTGGCNLLWHELKHADGLNHSMMAKQYPNEMCSVQKYPTDQFWCLENKNAHPLCFR